MSERVPVPVPAMKERRREIGSSLIFYNVGLSNQRPFMFVIRQKGKEESGVLLSASFSLSVICSLGSRKKCVVYHSTPQYNINHFSTLQLELHNNNNHLTVLKKQHRPVPFNSFCSMTLSAIKERRRGIGFSLMFYSVKCSVSGDFTFMTR